MIRQGEREYAINLVVIPNTLDNKLVLSAWMLEKGCTQQADALLESMRGELESK